MAGHTLQIFSTPAYWGWKRSENRLKVLLLAEMCNPNWTSVPLVGYNLARGLAEHPELDVTLVTQIRNRPALLDDDINYYAQVEYIDNEHIAGRFHQLSRFLRGGEKMSWTIDTALMWPSYVVFEKMVYRHFKEQLHSHKFDLIHRITPLTPTIPSPLARLSPVPMIIGPINGGLPWPEHFSHLRIHEREWLTPFRKAYQYLPYFRSTYRNLAGLILGSQFTRSEVPSYYRGLNEYMPENGINPDRFSLAQQWPAPKSRFRFINIARMVPLKGIDMILKAMASSTILRDCELVLIGDGPEREKLESLSNELQLGDRVLFRGWQNQKEISQELSQSQVFVFPSIKEFGGGVILEAMACGLPSIVMNYGGPAEIVTPETGIKLEMGPPEQIVTKLRQAMEYLATDPEQCIRFSAAGVDRVKNEFLWSCKAAQIHRFYQQVLQSKHDHLKHPFSEKTAAPLEPVLQPVLSTTNYVSALES